MGGNGVLVGSAGSVGGGDVGIAVGVELEAPQARDASNKVATSQMKGLKFILITVLQSNCRTKIGFLLQRVGRTRRQFHPG